MRANCAKLSFHRIPQQSCHTWTERTSVKSDERSMSSLQWRLLLVRECADNGLVYRVVAKLRRSGGPHYQVLELANRKTAPGNFDQSLTSQIWSRNILLAAVAGKRNTKLTLCCLLEGTWILSSADFNVFRLRAEIFCVFISEWHLRRKVVHACCVSRWRLLSSLVTVGRYFRAVPYSSEVSLWFLECWIQQMVSWWIFWATE
jgi:hypothetical protein